LNFLKSRYLLQGQNHSQDNICLLMNKNWRSHQGRLTAST
jgi:hypothetical protein